MLNLTTPIKIGLAAACLVVVAIIIAVDVARTRGKEEAAPAPAPAAALVEAYQPALQPPKPAAEPVICPTPAAPETPKPVAPVAQTPKPLEEPPKTYTVVQGHSLYGISVKLYGSPRHYERLYEANRDRIKDANTLQVGINLRVPDVTAKPFDSAQGKPAAR